MGGLSSVASGEGGFHGQNQNKNQNKTSELNGRGEKGLAGVLTGLGYSDGWRAGKTPGAGYGANGHPSAMDRDAGWWGSLRPSFRCGLTGLSRVRDGGSEPERDCSGGHLLTAVYRN